MRRAKLLDRQSVLVRSDVFLHGLPRLTLKMLRRAIAQGLSPSGLDFAGDDESIVVLRFVRPTRAGEARGARSIVSRSRRIMRHECCYHNCPREGVVHIGANGGDSHWICFRHLEKWNADRARFIADGGGCEMQELGEPLCEGCLDDATTRGEGPLDRS